MPLDDPLYTERRKGAYWVKLSDGRWVIGLQGLTRRDLPWIFVDPSAAACSAGAAPSPSAPASTRRRIRSLG
ncbi:MAG TPA: hypothetical protein VFA12_11835 [Stellaceae bacterium]|nr:hypothetical protein [Stellaceae bacterium]